MIVPESSPSVQRRRMARWRRDKVLVQRRSARARYDRSTIDTMIDTSLIAHAAFIDDGQPYCVPLLYGSVGDAVYVHIHTYPGQSGWGRLCARTVPAGSDTKEARK